MHSFGLITTWAIASSARLWTGPAKADIVFRDEQVTAFRDIHPAAPTHILIVPNRHIDSVNALEEIGRGAGRSHVRDCETDRGAGGSRHRRLPSHRQHRRAGRTDRLSHAPAFDRGTSDAGNGLKKKPGFSQKPGFCLSIQHPFAAAKFTGRFSQAQGIPTHAQASQQKDCAEDSHQW